MTVTIAVSFPLGRYHATPWDRSVNDAAVEWPPSPWRVLRALVSTWYERSDLPARDFDALLSVLIDPPDFGVPPSSVGQTVHYMPDREQVSESTGGTDKVMDSFAVLDPQAELLIRWPGSLSAEQAAQLASLVEQVPYLGRSESVCRARLLDPSDADSFNNLEWWRAVPGGTTTRRLGVDPTGFSRAVLETSPTTMRSKRSGPVPPGTRWLNYTSDRAVNTGRPARLAEETAYRAVRWSLHAKAPFDAAYGVLATDILRYAVLKALDPGEGPRDVALDRAVSGKSDGDPVGGKHDHAHWWWLPRESDPAEGRTGTVGDLVLWLPGGELTSQGLTVLLDGVNEIWAPGAYRPRGFIRSRLVLNAAGELDQVAPEVTSARGAVRWRSVTPFLPSRHPKGDVPDVLSEEVRRELGYRDLPSAEEVRVLVKQQHWVQRHRRYRLTKTMRDAKPGYAVELIFAEPVTGPLSLGALSHFGFGLFRPVTDELPR